MTLGPSTSDASEPDIAFLQERVAQFGKAIAILGFTFLAFRCVQGVVAGYATKLLTESTHLLHFGGAAALGVVWILCRSGTRSKRFVQTAETAGVLLSSFFYQLMGAYISPLSRPDLIMTLALSFSLIGRAIYVPSSARRTLLLTAAVGVPLVAVSYGIFASAPDEVTRVIEQALPPAQRGNWALVLAANVGAWWSLTTILATLASRVIYGLRREIKSARRLGQYTLEEKIGEGGMGAVYRARHAMLRRPTAVKLLLPHKTGAETLARFEREVQLTARLTNPNTITIFDYGRTSDGVFYYAMELLDGLDLESLVSATGAQPPARVLHVLDQVAGALHEAHGVGLIHRDIKPANIMLCRYGGVEDVAKVVDFGLVKQLNERSDVALTRAQSITGTPLYMSPEMIKAPDKIDGRSDLYAVGAVGYFMLTAQHVFDGGSLVEVCARHLDEKPIPPSQRGSRTLPADLEALVLACLEKDPASRPQTAAELQARVRACADFGQWGDKQAAEWRAQHNAQLVAHKASGKTQEPISGTGRTVEVDLLRRNRPEAPAQHPPPPVAR